MDGYFKLQRAEEEVNRLNVEIRRLATFMRDENNFLFNKQVDIQATHPALAHQIGLHRMEGSRFIMHHTKFLNQIVALKGYSGGSLLGTHVSDVEAIITMVPVPPVATPLSADIEATITMVPVPPVATPLSADIEATITMVPVPPVATFKLSADINLTLNREELEEEEAGDEEEREAMGAYYSVIQMSIDTTTNSTVE
jgi:hypothetical protein